VPPYALEHFLSRNAYFVAKTTNFRLEMFRRTFAVPFPSSISADEAVRATAGDVPEHVEATDRLEIERCWRRFAAVN